MGNGTTASLGQQIYSYAYNRMGQQVGTGECYDLADGALTFAGAKSAPSYGKITPTADYKWGKLIDVKQVQMGDVLQFKNFTFEVETTTKTTTKRSDGSSQIDTQVQTQSQSRPHHTALVASKGDGGQLLVLEQNVAPLGGGSPDRTVRANQIFTTTRKWSTKKTEQKGGAVVTTETTVKIKVSGKIWAYRPVKP